MLTVGKLLDFLEEARSKRIYSFELPFEDEEITFLANNGRKLLTIEIQDNMNGLVIRPTATPKTHIIIKQTLIGIRLSESKGEALTSFHESVGLFRGLFYGELLSSEQMRLVTLLAHNAFDNHN
jgi:hypothetical protein